MPDIRLVLEGELLARVDEARGDVPRVKWIRRAIEQQLDVGDGNERGRRLASEREDLVARGADPAELAVPVAVTGPQSFAVKAGSQSGLEQHRFVGPPYQKRCGRCAELREKHIDG